jgi:hypothetical protein
MRSSKTPLCAKSRLMHRSKKNLLDHLVGEPSSGSGNVRRNARWGALLMQP